MLSIDQHDKLNVNRSQMGLQQIRMLPILRAKASVLHINSTIRLKASGR